MNKKEVKQLIQEILKEEDRREFYVEYFRRLSPENFNVEREGDQIIITVKDND
jgi:hypothetical protein